MSYQVTRYHDFSAGHRVVGHENKCALLHGHNYRIHFTCQSTQLDDVGRVIDFSVIKSLLCEWLEKNWDHKMLLWDGDELMVEIENIVETLPPEDRLYTFHPASHLLDNSIVWVPFNPTAENMARYLVQVIGPSVLKGTGVTLTKVVVDETRKCSASFECINVGVIDES